MRQGGPVPARWEKAIPLLRLARGPASGQYKYRVSRIQVNVKCEFSHIKEGERW